MKKNICVPSFLSIGDPWYKEQYSGARLKELVFESSFPKTFVASLSIETCSEDGLVDIKVCIAPDNHLLALYEKDMYPARFNIKETVLGCDTACFEIVTRDKSIRIDTMADGFYGNAHRFTYNRKCQGAIVRLHIDSDLFDERMKQNFASIFPTENG